MSTSYIPSKDEALSSWMSNFSTLVTASPGTYGLMAADATAIATQVNLFNAALTLVVNPATKTKSTVADKNGKKAAMLVVVRQYAKAIKLNQGVSDAAKVALGLTINDTTRTPKPVPATAPLLALASAGSMRQMLSIADSADPTRKAKASNVQGTLVLAYVGTTPPSSPDLATFRKLATTRTAQLVYGSGDVGKTAWVYGAFYNPHGELGPISAPASLLITG